MTLRTLAVLALALFLMPAPEGRAGVPDEVVQADVISGWQTAAGTRMAAVRLRLAPGWKTYWRAPGDAGIPPSFDWSGSRNLAGVTVHFPSPTVFWTAGMRSIGYADEVVLPLELRAVRPGAPIEVTGRIDLGVCHDICVPASLRFTAELSGRGRSDPAIQAALAARPTPGPQAGVRSVACGFQPISDGMRLTASIAMPNLGREVAVVETSDPRVWVSEPQTERRGNTLTVSADLVPPRGSTLMIDRSAIRFTVIGRSQAVDILGCTE